MTKHHLAVTAATTVLGLGLPAAAQAHVTVQPNTAPSGGFVVEDVRVPNEEDKAITTKLQLQLPHGFASLAYQSTPGWKVTVRKEKLATPIKTDDGEVTEEVREVTWTARSTADGIAPGQFRDFPLSVQVPGKAGATLTFKALQTYSSGEVVRWIGAPGSDHPAPQVKVVAATDAHVPATPAATAPAASGGSKASKGLGIAALVIAIVGAAMAAAALARRRA